VVAASADGEAVAREIVALESQGATLGEVASRAKAAPAAVLIIT
jgi:hypothetical protein